MSNPTPDFSALTDAELDRWIAERDGWDFSGECPEHESGDVWLGMPDYARSADAAIALAGRWGYEWRRDKIGDGEFFVGVWKPFNGGIIASHCNESPEKPTARALSEALAQAKAREGKP